MGPKVANMKTLVIGTQASIGWLSGLSVFQTHQRN
jgi:hypothetical protein